MAGNNSIDVIAPLQKTDSLDTGTGGFNVEGKLQSYDVGVVSEEQSAKNYSAGSVNAAQGFVGKDGKPADISSGTKKTLADYLGKMTRGNLQVGQADGFKHRPNRYPVGDEGQGYTEIKLVGDNGVTPPVITTGPFATDKSGPAMASRSGDAVKIGDKFARGGSSVAIDLVDGHGLLRTATDQVTENLGTPFQVNINGQFTTALDEMSPAGQYTAALLNNRFTVQQPMSGKPTALYENSVINQDGNDNLNYKQFVRGYAKGSSVIPSSAQRFNMGQLAQVGTVLGLRATGELNTLSDADRKGLDPSSTTIEGIAALPGLAQLGVSKIERKILEARDVLDSLTDNTINPEQLVSIDGSTFNSNPGSYGSLNNALDQYSGISNLGMVALAGSMTIATLGLIESVSELIIWLRPSSKTQGQGSSDVVDAQGRRFIGSSTRRTAGDDFISSLGLADTYNDFWKCVRIGAAAFFGYADGVTMSSLGNTLLQPEFAVVTARSISRSFLTIADACKSLISAFNVNPVSGTKQIFNFVDVFRRSKAIGCLNVFATLGDAILNEVPNSVDSSATGGFGVKKSSIDSLEGIDAVSKNRLRGSIKLAWASYRSSDALIMPTNLNEVLPKGAYSLDSIAIDNDTGRKIYKGNGREGIASGYIQTDKGRIDNNIRGILETKLDSEYLPFYFHDLRTNEIVSFHAFLASLGDSFTANYDTAEGFGRIDPIKIYKNTNRKIDFSFHAVSTNSADFDSMWTKINKLTTLLYPQFTPGKRIDSTIDGANYKFYAPFSQMMSASPMIRLRIGDLISSNYSRFNLARLFGYGSPGVKFDISAEEKQNIDSSKEAKKQKLLDTEVENLKISGCKPGYTYLPDDDNDIEILSYFEKNPYSPYRSFLKNGGSFKFIEFVKNEKNNYPYGKFNLFIDPEAFLSPNEISELNVYLSSIKNANTGMTGSDIAVTLPLRLLRPSSQTMNKIRSQAEQNVRSSNPELFSAPTRSFGTTQFFGEENNSIVKSFKTVEGKGIAGFIDSMTFDWHDKVTWAGVGDNPDIKTANTMAPKMCKITISFTPIHDISPGIDHMGLNRAPVYPIGPLGRKGI